MYALIAFLLGFLAARQPEKQSQNTQHKANGNDGKTLPGGPISGVCIPPTSEERTKQEQSERRKRIKFWAEIAGLVVLSIYTTFAALQWSAMRQTVRMDQRPWIEVTAEVPPPQAFNEVIAHVALINVGKSPSKAINAKFFIAKVKNGDTPRFEYSNLYFSVTTGVIFPDKTVEATFSMVHPESQPEKLNLYSLSQQDFLDYQAQKVFFVLYANVEYFDSFGIKHWTHFCNFITPEIPNGGVTARECTDYNAADNNY